MQLPFGFTAKQRCTAGVTPRSRRGGKDGQAPCHGVQGYFQEGSWRLDALQDPPISRGSGRKGICTHQLIRTELPKGKSIIQCWKGANPRSKREPHSSAAHHHSENCLSTSLEVKFKSGAYVTAFWQEDKLQDVRGPQMDALKEGRCLPDRVPLH